MARKRKRNFYILMIGMFLITSFIAVGQGCYSIVSSEVVSVMFASFFISLIFFLASVYFFEKAEVNSDEEAKFKTLGNVLYFLSFPLNLLIVFVNIGAIMSGPSHWAFG